MKLHGENDIVIKLLLQTVEHSVSDEEIAVFLSRYGFPQVLSIERILGAGSRPAVLLVFRELSPEALRVLQSRIHHVFWNNHVIEAIALLERPE